MRYASFPGVERPLARLVMGGMSAPAVGGQIVLDEYFELGGNVLDSAFIYGGADEAIGHWLRTRGSVMTWRSSSRAPTRHTARPKR